MGARTYQQLEVWQLCEQIRERVIAETATGPALADRRFCNQLRAAAEDAVSDVAEGFGRFRPREFAQFIGYAIASNSEVLERTRFAHARGYISDASAASVIVLCVRAHKALKSLRKYLWNVAPHDVPSNRKAAPLRRRRRLRQPEEPPR